MVALAMIVMGMGLSVSLWGKSTLAPLTFASTRQIQLSVDLLLPTKSTLAPLWFTPHPNMDHLVADHFVRRLAACLVVVPRAIFLQIEAACVIAVTTTALLYQTGFPQYHMVPFAVGGRK